MQQAPRSDAAWRAQTALLTLIAIVLVVAALKLAKTVFLPLAFAGFLMAAP